MIEENYEVIDDGIKIGINREELEKNYEKVKTNLYRIVINNKRIYYNTTKNKLFGYEGKNKLDGERVEKIMNII